MIKYLFLFCYEQFELKTIAMICNCVQSLFLDPSDSCPSFTWFQSWSTSVNLEWSKLRPARRREPGSPPTSDPAVESWEVSHLHHIVLSTTESFKFMDFRWNLCVCYFLVKFLWCTIKMYLWNMLYIYFCKIIILHTSTCILINNLFDFYLSARFHTQRTELVSLEELQAAQLIPPTQSFRWGMPNQSLCGHPIKIT